MMTGMITEQYVGTRRHGEVLARGISVDSRERPPTEECLAEGRRQFAIQVSHELRTPLTALRLELEEALTHRDAADPYVALKQALHSTERLENTVIALLRLLQRDTRS
jgi:signal transduction histidine kinase